MIPAWEILTECVSQAQSQIDLTGESATVGILNEHVMSVVVPYSRDSRSRFAITPRPALVFTAPRSVSSPASAGNNCEDYVFYVVLAQILHTELSLHTSTNTQNILKWEYNVRRYFSMGNLRNEVFDTEGRVTLATIPQNVDVFNEKIFHVFDDCVAAIPIAFKCIEPHDADGRV